MKAFLAAIILFGANTGALFSQQICVGLGDLNGDAVVDLNDYSLIASCLGGPQQSAVCNPTDGQIADVDDDGDVDLRDYRKELEYFGLDYFDYGLARANAEAEQLAMAVSGELRAPDAEYERIVEDLALIREEYPALVSVVDDEDYVPNEMIVALINGQSLLQYKELNRFYQVTDEDVLFGTTFVLTFCGSLNVPLLAQEYTALAAVNYAEPNGFIGLDDQITVTALGTTYRYSIDDGFWDCFDGCDCHRLWEIEVNSNGDVALISYEEQGFEWCEF